MSTSELYEAVRREIDEFRSGLDEVLVDGKVTWDEAANFVRLVYNNIRDVIAAFVLEAERMGGTKEDKQEAIVACIGQFYDEVLEPLNLPGPDRVLDPLAKMALVEASRALVAYLQDAISNSGRFKLVRVDDDTPEAA